MSSLDVYGVADVIISAVHCSLFGRSIRCGKYGVLFYTGRRGYELCIPIFPSHAGTHAPRSPPV